jgi:hypothetical protein
MEYWSDAFLLQQSISGSGGEPVLSESKDRFVARLAPEALLNGLRSNFMYNAWFYPQGCSCAACRPAILPATKHSVIFPASR